MDRVAMLRQLAESKPNDPFPRYGLAMELVKANQADAACEAFAALVDAHRSYVPTYLMYGNLLAKLGRHAQARDTYTRGMEVARQAGEQQALGELEAARDELPISS